MMQHLTAVRAVATVSGGSVEGALLESSELRFRPGAIKAGQYAFDVAEERGSAGSTGLVLQALLPVLLMARAESVLTLKGGTHTKWSPPTTYLKEVFSPALGLFGSRLSIETEKYGWYPRGGGVARAALRPALPLKPVNLTGRGLLESARGLSLLSNLPFHIVERQRRQALQRMKGAGVEVDIEAKGVPAVGQGTFVMLWFRFADGISGFSALGERGKSAEKVADEACDEAIAFMRSDAAVDVHLGDQLPLYMALADGESAITVPRMTAHLTTNIWTIEQFLSVKFRVDATEKGAVRVAVKGIGIRADDG